MFEPQGKRTGLCPIPDPYGKMRFPIRYIEQGVEPSPAPEKVTLYGVGNRRAEPTTPEPARPELGIEGSSR